MNTKDQIPTDYNPRLHIYTAINDVSKRLAGLGISKNRSNEQQGFKFRGIDDIYNALAFPMAEAKMCILPRVQSRSVTERQTNRGTALFYVVLDVEFDLVSAVDGSRHTIRVTGEAMDTGDKATNKAMSAAYKYACMQTFCIPTEGDNDADATTHSDIVHTRADPRGDAREHADKATVTRATNAIAKAVREDDGPAMRTILRKLSGMQDEFIAVMDQLQSREREYVDLVMDEINHERKNTEAA